MPAPTVDQIAPGGIVQLNNAPAALDDATFDNLFPADSRSVEIAPVQTGVAQPVQQTQGTQQTAQPVAGTTTQGQEFFLKGERSVYKSLEEATKGVNEKDAVIEQLRTRYALTTGIDPITGQPVAANGQPAEKDYSSNPALYLDDLYAAAKKGGPEAYRDVQQKFILDTLKPLQPLLQKSAREQGAATMATEIAGADKFIGTPAYTRALEANPELKQAVTFAESDYRFHSRLPGLYKLAYLTAQGMQLPELLRANTAGNTTQQTAQTQTAQPVRTTVQPTTANVARETAQPSFGTLEGIKATIAAAEARGAKLTF